MNNYNPNIHNRHSIRLKVYDYSQAGLYFITICVHDRKCLFGEIVVGVDDVRDDNVRVEKFQSRQEMILNDAGKIADECWLEIPKHFPNAVLHKHIVMPNHVHGIIELIQTGSPTIESGSSVGVENFQPLQSPNESISYESQKNEFQKIIPRSIGSVVKGFKIGVTKWFRNNTVGANNVGVQNIEHLQIWQRNYYEHIIRDEKSYQRISEYIVNNPADWQNDKLFNQ